MGIWISSDLTRRHLWTCRGELSQHCLHKHLYQDLIVYLKSFFTTQTGVLNRHWQSSLSILLSYPRLINLDVCFTFTFPPSVRPWGEWIKSKCLTQPNGSWWWNGPMLLLPRSAALQDADKQLQACRDLICFAEWSNNFCLFPVVVSQRSAFGGHKTCLFYWSPTLTSLITNA